MATDGRSSFGVELEMMIAIKRDTKELPKPYMFHSSPGAPLLVPAGESTRATIQRVLGKLIEDTAQNHMGDRVATDGPDIDFDMNSWHLRDYTDWTVARDSSVSLPEGFLDLPNVNAYDWTDVEIKSPALFATDKSYDEVRHVIQALTNNFWVFAPESAGLHIHYGRGRDWIPFVDLRRIGTFFFAADPIVCQLHPQTRRIANSFCISNRLYSQIAHGLPAKEAGERVTRRNGEAPEEEYDPNIPAPQPEPRPVFERGETFTSIFRRGGLDGYILSRPEFQRGLEGLSAARLLPQASFAGPIDIPTAAQELLRVTNAPTLATMLGVNYIGRTAYNFTAYGDNYRVFATALGIDSQFIQPKRTIEFRQPAGTLEADEVVAHTKIAVGLADYASKVDIADLWKMILDLTNAELHGDWYDVFDLLSEVNLIDEARIIERQMANQRGIEIKQGIEGTQGLARPRLRPASRAAEVADRVREIVGPVVVGDVPVRAAPRYLVATVASRAWRRFIG
ncbi:putative amidoligase enzyme-domain-containing protein [Hypoxylon sp. NC1633]|nr:putative amidoligase enzyme-domain-containing protein [Hypoxylon sp. NC1633]